MIELHNAAPVYEKEIGYNEAKHEKSLLWSILFVEQSIYI